MVVSILLVVLINLGLLASLDLGWWYCQACGYAGDQVMMLIFLLDGSVFIINEGLVLCQPDASQEDIMLSCVVDKELSQDMTAGDQQVQFKHNLDYISMLVVESRYADTTMLNLEELDLKVLLNYGQELGVNEGFTTCSRINQCFKFKLYAVLGKMALDCECWSTEDVVQSDAILVWRLISCSFQLLWAGDFTQSHSFPGIR